MRDSPATGLLIGESLQAAGGRVAEGRGKEETRPQQAALITSGDRGHHYPAVRAAVRGRASAFAIARARRHQDTVEALHGERVRIGPWYKHAAKDGPPGPVERGTRAAPDFQVVVASLLWHVHEYAHAYKPLPPKRTSGPPPSLSIHPSPHPARERYTLPPPQHSRRDFTKHTAATSDPTKQSARCPALTALWLYALAFAAYRAAHCAHQVPRHTCHQHSSAAVEESQETQECG